MRLFLHIGPHKTGTTAIQGLLSRNAGLLERHGIRYPRPVDGSHNHHFVAHGLREPSLREATMGWIRTTLDESESMGCRACVLSSEMFVEHGIPIRLLSDWGAGRETIAIAYIRRPDQMWASAYSQLVVEPGVRRSARIVQPPLPYDCSLSSVLRKWMRRFPPGRLVLAPFEPAQWPGGNLLRDFLGMIGAPEDLFERCDPSPHDANASLPSILTEAIRVANATGRIGPEAHAKLVERARRIAGRLPRALRRPARLDARAARQAFDMLEPWLPAYRPYYRAGFDDSFLRRRGAKVGAIR